MQTGKIGVLGGTFDPIHYGHLRLAEEARSQLQLDRVLFIPAGSPPHKSGEPVSPARDRFHMALIATAGHPQFEVSSMELDRIGPSYTVDTLTALRREWSPTAEIHFIIGADAVLEMHTWREPERVLQLCRLAIAARPGFDLEALRRVPVAGLWERVDLLQGTITSISATDIRRRVRERESIRYLTPADVEAYILKRGIYQAPAVYDRADSRTLE